MKKVTTILFLTFITATVIAQTIPSSRRVDWSGMGSSAAVPVSVNIVSVTGFGAKGDGVTNDYTSIANAITSLGGHLGVIYFPAGHYLIKSTLQLPDSVILRGDCSDSSFLQFNFNGAASDCIYAQKSVSTAYRAIRAGFSKDTTAVVLDSTAGFAVGDWAEIKETNGAWDAVPISWAVDCVGQLVQITAINGNTITFQNPLRIDYTPSLNPVIRKWVPRTFVGIEDLTIDRTDATAPSSGYCMSFSNALNCWIKGVESDHSVAAHVSISTCSNFTISGCYFHNAYQLYDGTSTRGYGVLLIQHTGQCLVENNIFDHLRHSIIMKQGANGNVAGYNYCLNEYRPEFPTDAGADLCLHGHYSFSNLLEGNIVNNIMVDSTWGPTGPYTTFYRNRATLYGILMTPGASVDSDTLNYVGNETTNSSFLHGLYVITGTNHFQYGNNILGTITPAGTTNLTDTSYYRTTFSDFWPTAPYPPTAGPPNALGSGSIPAKDRYTSGDRLTISPNPPCIFTNAAEMKSTDEIMIYPNPSGGNFAISFSKDLNSPLLKIFNTLGEEIYSEAFNGKRTTINRKLSSGIYFVQMRAGERQWTKKVVIE